MSITNKHNLGLRYLLLDRVIDGRKKLGGSADIAESIDVDIAGVNFTIWNRDTPVDKLKEMTDVILKYDELASRITDDFKDELSKLGIE